MAVNMLFIIVCSVAVGFYVGLGDWSLTNFIAIAVNAIAVVVNSVIVMERVE